MCFPPVSLLAAHCAAEFLKREHRSPKSLASQVEAIEKNNCQLHDQLGRERLEHRETQRKLRNVSGGNVVMVNRDGFSKAMTIPGISPSHSLGFCPDYDLRAPHYLEEHAVSASCTVRHYRNTFKQDAAGRWIYQEQ